MGIAELMAYEAWDQIQGLRRMGLYSVERGSNERWGHGSLARDNGKHKFKNGMKTALTARACKRCGHPQAVEQAIHLLCSNDLNP